MNGWGVRSMLTASMPCDSDFIRVAGEVGSAEWLIYVGGGTNRRPHGLAGQRYVWLGDTGARIRIWDVFKRAPHADLRLLTDTNYVLPTVIASRDGRLLYVFVATGASTAKATMIDVATRQVMHQHDAMPLPKTATPIELADGYLLYPSNGPLEAAIRTEGLVTLDPVTGKYKTDFQQNKGHLEKSRWPGAREF